MRKGFSIGLAMALMLTLTVPAFAGEEQTEIPEVTPAPEESNLPEETSISLGTESPEETSTLEHTEPPGESSMPEDIEPPEETSTPENTELPERISAPEDIEPLEETSTPENTELPDGIPTPEDTVPSEETVTTEENIEQQADDLPIIDVTVSEFGRIVINPYGLPVDMNGEDFTEQIVSETLTIINHSEVPVTVWSSAVGSISPPSVMTYTSELPMDAGEKEVFLYAEFQAEDGIWSGTYSGADNQICVSNQVSEPKAVLTLDTETEGMFRFFGAASVAPNVPWCTEDVLSVIITFTFSADSVPFPSQEMAPALEPIPEPTSEPSPDIMPDTIPDSTLQPTFAPELESDPELKPKEESVEIEL